MERYKRELDYSYCLGMSLTVELLKHRPESIIKVIVSSKAIRNYQYDLLLDLCDKNGIEIDTDDHLISKLSAKENCYCIGFFRKYESSFSSAQHLLLYHFDDFGELGTILRSAVSFDYKDIALIDTDLDYFDPRCIRASMGSIFLCNIIRFDSLEEYLNSYKKQSLYPLISHGHNKLQDLVLPDDNYALLISQDEKELDEKCPDGYYLEHYGKQEVSLSIRSSVFLSMAYHLKRSR